MREVLRPRPYLSAGILLAGVIALWFSCQRAIYTRGYPPIDPLWQAMPWLWVFPLLVSAIYDRDRKRRFWQLLCYSVAVGFILGGVFGGGVVPRRVSIWSMLWGAAFISPFILGASWVLDRGAQKVLGYLRQFELSDKCAKCGYCIRHLTEPRCPECGEPFDEQWLDESYNPPRAAKYPRRTSLLAVLLLLACCAAPFIYHESALAMAAARGRADAERDWASGEAILYSPPWEMPGFGNVYDIDTGLLLRSIVGGLEQETYGQAYRQVIDDKLREFGPPTRKPTVLSREHIEELLASDRLERVLDFPYRPNEQVAITRDESEIRVTHRRAHGGSSAFSTSKTDAPVRICQLPDHDSIIVVVAGYTLMTFDTEGTMLQYVHIIDGKVWDELP